MKTKLCKKCNLNKAVASFRLKKDKCGKYYIYSYCKECEKLYIKNNNDKKKIADKKYRDTHKEKIKLSQRKVRKQLSPEQQQKMKQYYQKYSQIWRENNKDKTKSYYMKDIKKRRMNPFLHFKDQIRHEILRSFKSKGKSKNHHTEQIVNMDLKELYIYLLQTFKNNYGYEWNGVEKVHIDHIMPLSMAKTEQDIIKLCNYSNLQLLKEKDNLRKHNKLDWELQK